MPPGTLHLLREDEVALFAVIVLEALCWGLIARAHALPLLRVVRGPLGYIFAASGLLVLGSVIEDVRPAEVLILLACGVIPAIALTLERTQPRSLGKVLWIVTLAPAAAMTVLTIRGFAIPAIACANHMIDHAEVHRQWRLEYRALLELEAMRARQTGESRFELDADDLPPASDVEVTQAVGPPEGWAYTATPKNCGNCRSFYLDSNDVVRSARRRTAINGDRRVYNDEIHYIRNVIHDGCYVLGDVLCH